MMCRHNFKLQFDFFFFGNVISLVFSLFTHPIMNKYNTGNFEKNTGKNNNQRNETNSFERPVCYNFPYRNHKTISKRPSGNSAY